MLSNYHSRGVTNKEQINRKYRTETLLWYGHMQRMNKNRLPQKAYECYEINNMEVRMQKTIPGAATK